jgi:hypothetical protein
VINASLCWLNNVSGVYLIQLSLLFICQQGMGHFFRYWPLLPIGWRIVQVLRQRRRITTNTAPTTLSVIKQQANPLLSVNCYTPLVISRNEKNKQQTLCQSKLALTEINKTFCITIIRPLKNLKPANLPLVWPT